MYSLEDRKRAVELYIKYDLCAADVIHELGYPSKKMLRLWHREFIETGELHEGFRGDHSKYTAEQKKAAVDYYLEHGRSLLYLSIENVATGGADVFLDLPRCESILRNSFHQIS